MKKSSSNANPQATTIDVASILGELHASFDNADAARAASLANIASARTARGYMLQRRRDDLASVLGSEAPEVTALDASIKANAVLATSLATQSSFAARPPAPAAEDETIVQGVVRDRAGKPVEGVKVALAEPKGEVLATTSSARDGHFVLRHKAASKAAVPERIEVRVHDKRHPTPIELERGNGVALVMVHLEG